MRKYNIANYVRYKKDVEAQLSKVKKPVDGDYTPLTNKEIQINFLPLVETLARKQSTSDQASGVLSINDLLQEGALGLCAAVTKLDRDLLIKSDDQEKTIKSFLSKRIKGAIRRAVDINRGDIRIPEHKLNEIRRNPKDERMVAMFFNSIFSSIDDKPNDDVRLLEDLDLSKLHEALGKKPIKVYTYRDLIAIYDNEDEIRSISPDMEKLKQLEFPSVVVTSIGRDVDFVSRNFAPRLGIPEDPVTGSTHCELIPYWSDQLNKKEMIAHQLSERGGRIYCTNNRDRVSIGGEAVTFLRGEIELK